MTELQIINSIWHDLVEDNNGFEFCAGLLKQNENINITAYELKKLFKKYFPKYRFK